ncbi:class I SAM-dependent DNA methyltransferase [Amorphus sp. 3PC139-8]|uniref:class I SAM-dependent DNA methyltransferase n=1 Tax=Amorphus sp. 3PC139-8 TaxID=2735676 RepID=UPI00345D891A
MNAVEIEKAISDLAEQPFDAEEFPYLFLQAFGNKETTLKRLRRGDSNKSDFDGPWGGVLQTNNIHIAVAAPGEVPETLKRLKASPATTRAKAKFILATDGDTFEAEDLASGETVACAYADFPNHFGLFLPLAGITTVKQIRDNAFDIRATRRLNQLYVELLSTNPDWGTDARRPDMNHFMARLIFCFFAEDTDIFNGEGVFTDTIAQMSARDASDTDFVIGEIFRAMNTRTAERAAAKLPRWADHFPYVNGGLFSGSLEVPRFSRIARSYLLHIGNLDWKQINPDIFGSMIQAVADDEERGALGMHYTSVPNILKVLNPLFLDDLRETLEAAGDNARKLLNLRNRMARIRVFDPACGSGNFLVIAYKEMRAIEAEINRRRKEDGRKSDIPLTNFRGIELRNFPAEIARLALIIAEYQCDVVYRGQKEALRDFLPLDAQNWITCGNALRIDWLSICPPTGTGVAHKADDLFHTPLDQAQIDFENEGGETYICGNPPYKGSQDQSKIQKADLQSTFPMDIGTGSADYVMGWFAKGAQYLRSTQAQFAFVATNSIHQGRQVARFWPKILKSDLEIFFSDRSFKWSNLAAKKAAVIVSVIAVGHRGAREKKALDGELARNADFIGPYLLPNVKTVVEESRTTISALPKMSFGSMPNDGGSLLLRFSEYKEILKANQISSKFIHPVAGTNEFIKGIERRCIWVADSEHAEASRDPHLSERFDRVEKRRATSPRLATSRLASTPYKFGEIRQTGNERVIIVAKTCSENREYLPADLLPIGTIVTEAFALLDAPLWSLSIASSRLHKSWMATVCGKMKTDYRYSNTLGWNTFPIRPLTEKQKADLTRCAEDILLAREAHFPATIADLYDPDAMPENLRAAHDRNDEVLERIYIGRRFRNDTERLEKLFELYTEMTATAGQSGPRAEKA